MPSSAFSAAASANGDHPVEAAMRSFAASAPALPLAVALSGGADSTALLLACTRRWPGQVHAWHVHHGLQAMADHFEHHCNALCARLGVPLQVHRVQAHPAAGQSPEDAARVARYAAFDAMALTSEASAAVSTVVLGHHADDQIETLLLALSRGAGLPGLAAMPAHWRRATVAYARPLLAVPGAALRDWLREQGETWVEDPSNADTRYTRNHIRAQLLPALAQVLPHFRVTFARSAAHAAQAQTLLHELAEQDLATCGVPPAITVLRALSPARQANVLRHWLANAHGTTPSSAQMRELLSQLAACTTRGHGICLKAGRGRLQRQGEHLVWTEDAKTRSKISGLPAR